MWRSADLSQCVRSFLGHLVRKIHSRKHPEANLMIVTRGRKYEYAKVCMFSHQPEDDTTGYGCVNSAAKISDAEYVQASVLLEAERVILAPHPLQAASDVYLVLPLM